MKALIDGSGRIVDVAAAQFPVAASLLWVDCPAGVTTAWRYEGGEFIAPAAPTLEQDLAAIDLAAESVRVRYVPHALVVAEYEQAERDAAAFKAGGYSGQAPAAVATWAAAKGWTSQAAADDILLAAAQLRGILMQIRSVRLAGKEARRAGTKTSAQVVAELQAL
jgi:hypothetical protein